MDTIRYRWNTCLFKDMKWQNWINPAISWHTKWEIDKRLFGKQINWVDKLMSTTLIWIDLWHFAKMIMISSFIGSILLYQPIFKWYVDVIILYCAFTCTFEIFFSKIWIKKPNNPA